MLHKNYILFYLNGCKLMQGNKMNESEVRAYKIYLKQAKVLIDSIAGDIATNKAKSGLSSITRDKIKSLSLCKEFTNVDINKIIHGHPIYNNFYKDISEYYSDQTTLRVDPELIELLAKDRAVSFLIVSFKVPYNPNSELGFDLPREYNPTTFAGEEEARPFSIKRSASPCVGGDTKRVYTGSAGFAITNAELGLDQQSQDHSPQGQPQNGLNLSEDSSFLRQGR